jgi:hypothetical protein
MSRPPPPPPPLVPVPMPMPPLPLPWTGRPRSPPFDAEGAGETDPRQPPAPRTCTRELEVSPQEMHDAPSQQRPGQRGERFQQHEQRQQWAKPNGRRDERTAVLLSCGDGLAFWFV